MKIFHKGKLVSPYEKGRKIEGRAKINRRLIAQYKFDNTLYDLIPEFNDGFTYEYKDILDGEVTIRTIYSDSLPTTVRFGARTTSNMTLSLLEVDYLNTSNVTDMSYMFYNCGSLTSLDVNNFNTSNVTDMQYMFCNCKKLTTLDVSNFDTSNVTNMFNMFGNCTLLTKIEGLENFNTSKVINMGQLFMSTALTELDLSRFDVSKVTNIDYIFQFDNALTKLNLSNWHIQPDVRVEVPFMGTMTFTIFTNCYELTNIIMNDSDCNSINKIISVLPTRTSDSKGTLDIVGIDDISQVDIDTLNSKYWTIISHTVLNNARLGQTKLN